MKFSALFLYLSLALVFGGCQTNKFSSNNESNPKNETITVSAAASLKDAFSEIGESYRAKFGKSVTFNFGASGALQKQIEAGAPVDVFASAGASQMNELAAKNLIDGETRRDFARNSLILIAPKSSNINSFEDLTKPEVQKIAVGNPKTVPAGQYAEETLIKLNVLNEVKSKLILAENVRQVLDYVARGETDAGIVYQTDTLAAKDQIRVVIKADEASHTPILYPVAVVSGSEKKHAAREFAEFLVSAEGQKILSKYGFADTAEK